LFFFFISLPSVFSLQLARSSLFLLGSLFFTTLLFLVSSGLRGEVPLPGIFAVRSGFPEIFPPPFLICSPECRVKEHLSPSFLVISFLRTTPSFPATALQCHVPLQFSALLLSLGILIRRLSRMSKLMLMLRFRFEKIAWKATFSYLPLLRFSSRRS